MAKKRKPFAKLQIALFCSFIGIFALLYILLPHDSFSEKEKRTLAEFPEVSLSSILDGSFESGFETWLSDHVPGRDALVGLHAYYELASGRNGLSGVILGRDGSLFAAPEEADMEQVVNKCSRINALAEATGVPTSVMLIPTSGYMHPEVLPALHASYPDGEVAEAVREALSDGIAFLWPEDRFLAHADEELYYHTDHHLTSRGAYEACACFVESLGLAPVDASSYEIETIDDFYGSMYAKAGLWNVKPDRVEIWRSQALGNVTVSFDDRDSSDSLFFPEHLTEMDKYPVFLDGNHALVTIETDRADGENLLIVRDSFGHCFAPFAADYFKSITLVDLRYYRLPISALAKELEIDRMLVLYGMDTFLTDTNFAWMK
ncbi:MAG: DHHW family protein [Candidatus Faecivicinus sp.]